jgi:hypothetical protein
MANVTMVTVARRPRGSRQLFRSLYIWWVFAVFFGFNALLTAGATFNGEVPVAGRIVCGLITVAIAVGLVRTRGAGIWVDDSGVTVRRYSGINRSVPWGDVDRFELVPTGNRMNSGVYVAVFLTDGSRLTTQGLAAGSQTSKRGLELVGELEASRPHGTG